MAKVADLVLGNGGCSLLALDLSGVRFIDCSGLAALMTMNHECERHRATFKIHDAPPCVLRLLALADLDDVLPVC